MYNAYARLSLLVGFFSLQLKYWQRTIRYRLRFLLCGITGFLAFSIFAPLKTAVIGNEDEFIMLFF